MEKEKKTVTVEIPEGKKAVWNEQGILQLVDEEKANEPKDVTERIKTIYDAVNELAQRAGNGDCEAKRLIDEYICYTSKETSTDLIAYLQLRIITAALNEGWKPQFVKGEERWFPYFDLWTKEDLDEIGDEYNEDPQILLWDRIDSAGTLCGSEFSYAYNAKFGAAGKNGSRLAYKTKELAKYAGRQFASIYARFYFDYKASCALLWREYKEKRKSSDNK